LFNDDKNEVDEIDERKVEEDKQNKL